MAQTKSRWVPRHHEISAGREQGHRGNRERDPVGEGRTRQVDGAAADVTQLDEFEVVGIQRRHRCQLGRRGISRMKGQFSDGEGGRLRRSAGDVSRRARRSPDRSFFDSRGQQDRGGYGETPAADHAFGTRRHRAPRLARVAAVGRKMDRLAGGRTERDHAPDTESARSRSRHRAGRKLAVDPGAAIIEPRFQILDLALIRGARLPAGWTDHRKLTQLRPASEMSRRRLRSERRRHGVDFRRYAGVAEHAVAQRGPAVDELLPPIRILLEPHPPWRPGREAGERPVPAIGPVAGDVTALRIVHVAKGPVVIPQRAHCQFASARDMTVGTAPIEVAAPFAHDFVVDLRGHIGVLGIR